MPTISFLILTYNSSHHIDTLLDSIFAQCDSEIKTGKYEVIIVDNDSKDDTVKKIREYFKNSEQFSEKNTDGTGIFLHVSKDNLGYAKGINKAASFTKGNLLIVINPDAKLIEADFDKIVEEFDDKKIAIAGLNMIDFENNKEANAGKFFNPFTFFLYAMGFENLFGLRLSPSKKTKVDYVSGGFVVFKKELFDKLGGYDEDYFMYVEDMDICYRAKKLGYYTYFLPLATVQHKGQGSSNREFAIVNIYRGLQIFYKKNASLMTELYIKNLLSLKAALIIFIGTLLGKKELVATYMKALKTIS